MEYKLSRATIIAIVDTMQVLTTKIAFSQTVKTRESKMGIRVLAERVLDMYMDLFNSGSHTMEVANFESNVGVDQFAKFAIDALKNDYARLGMESYKKVRAIIK